MTVAFVLSALLDRHFAVFGRFASAPIAVAVQDNKVPQAIRTGGASAVNRCAILTICGICAAHRLWRLRRERRSITRAGALSWQSA